MELAAHLNLRMVSQYYLISLYLAGLAIINVVADESCQHEVVESMPDKLVFNASTTAFKPSPTSETLVNMVNESKGSIKIASFYLTLTAEPEFKDHPTAQPGIKLMDAIVSAVTRGVKLEVALDKSSRNEMSNKDDVRRLGSLGVVKFVNMTKLLGSGVLHTKFMIVDDETFYVGSSNFDWRSYTQIKEIGIKFMNCPTLATDLNKIFQTYFLLADSDKVPEVLPENLHTKINKDNPYEYRSQNGSKMNLFLTGSPPAFNGLNQWAGRTDDIDGILDVIEKARHRIDISVMNYSPRTEFIFPKKFWPRIDDALRKAASDRRIRVRLLISDWSHVKDEELMWYRSLDAVQSKALKGGGISVKMFKVPAFDDFQRKIPYSRVKHDKYMVTDNALYIGTSNWAADYFINTCGVGVVMEKIGRENDGGSSIVEDMQGLFERDFTSIYTHALPPAE